MSKSHLVLNRVHTKPIYLRRHLTVTALRPPKLKLLLHVKTLFAYSNSIHFLLCYI